MFNLNKFQREQMEWTNKNFPNQKPYQPLLGIMEEVGELSHAHLKAEQDIRGTQEEHYYAKVDAVADILVFLAGYCNQVGIDLEQAIKSTWEQVKKRDWKKNNKDGT